MSQTVAPVGERYRTLGQHIYDEVLTAILDGRIKSRQRLVLDDLAAQLKVSQTPVRDALARLAAEGVVENSGRRGFRVTALSAEDLTNLYDLGLMCELHAIEKGLANLTPRVLEQLERLANETARSGDPAAAPDRLSFLRADRRFHCAIVELAGNVKLTELFDRLNASIHITRVGIRRVTPEEQRAVNGPEHLAIVEALKSGDLRAVKEALRAHSLQGLRRGLARLEEEAPDGPFSSGISANALPTAACGRDDDRSGLGIAVV